MSRSTPSVLPESKRIATGFTAEDVAAICRATALEVIDGALAGWGKKELATWLETNYRQVTLLQFSAAELAWDDIVAPAHHTALPSALITSARVQRLLAETYDTVKVELARFGHGQRAGAFLHRVVDIGGVVRCTDDAGNEAFVPADKPGMRLVDRVLSLFASDVLVNRADYDNRVFVCRRCARVEFDAAGRNLGECVDHAASGVRTVPTADVPAWAARA